MKKFLKILGWSLLVLLLVGAWAGYRIVWGHPFTLNQLANRQATFFLFRNPELFTTIGLVDGTLIDRHSGKLAAVGVEKRDSDYAFARDSLAELREFTEPEAAEDSQDQAGDISKFPTHAADLGTDVAREELDASIATRRSAELAEIAPLDAHAAA